MNVLVIKDADFSANKLETIELDRVHTESIMVSPTVLDLDVIGATEQLTVTVYPSDSEDSIAFRSTDENVATVSNTGLITVVGVGTCRIVASSYNKTATCTVRVTVELTGSKFRSTYANAANASNTLTSVSTANTAGANDLYMLQCDGEAVFNHLMINTNMVALKDGAYDIQLPSEMNATTKRVYDLIGYPIPVILPPNTKKIHCISPTENYGAYPLFFKHDVRASESGSGTINRGYCSPTRELTNPIGSYNILYQVVTDINVPSGYDSVAVTWKSNGTDADFRNMDASTFAEFKVICM